jgi:GNAT superfamily N-acetyltransferase
MHIDYLADRPNDIDALAPPLVEYWRFVLPGDTLEIRRAKLRGHLNRTDLPIAWVAHEGGPALGIAALRTHDLPGYEHLSPWLGGVFVLPEFRRKGIASALCHYVERCAAQLGHTRLYLFTLDQRSLYKNLGWAHLQRAFWSGHEADIMFKNVVEQAVAPGRNRESAWPRARS